MKNIKSFNEFDTLFEEKIFKKTYLPDEIKYNNKIYIRGEKTKKSIKVEVLSTNLKGKTNLHGKLYKPTIFWFNPKEE